MQYIRNIVSAALIAASGLIKTAAKDDPIRDGIRIGPGRRTMYTYWGGARRIRRENFHPRYMPGTANKTRENNRRAHQQRKKEARQIWRDFEAELKARNVSGSERRDAHRAWKSGETFDVYNMYGQRVAGIVSGVAHAA